uniref:Uncharacterized protein n=1 Tax=Rhizophora mucronata TaxID=61149 RepID=A0A2P2NTA7_RHIMU
MKHLYLINQTQNSGVLSMKKKRVHQLDVPLVNVRRQIHRLIFLSR